MKGGTVQINWHDTKPVLTLDFHPVTGILATGGADFDIKLWLINSGDMQKKPEATYQSSLSYHGSTVNAVRFSSSGEQFASGADGGELVIWKLQSSNGSQAWKFFKTLLYHRKDVLDIKWSTNGEFLISGSVDNCCIIWDVNKGSVYQILTSHFHYVQGVAWDPFSQYVASLSSDRTCCIYAKKRQSKTEGNGKIMYECQHVITKMGLHMADDSQASKSHLFHDETLPSFFRRLDWSPDGSFLLVPAGSYKISQASEALNTTYVFSRKDLSRPALLLPSANKPVVVVQFCPMAFSLRGSTSAEFFKLPYRLVFAVATLNSLYIYDTESVQPIAIMAGLHYAAITDIAWSPTGKYVALSSQDGYCTLVEFEDNELGSPISLSEEKEFFSNANRSSIQMALDNVHEPISDKNNTAAAEMDISNAVAAETHTSGATATTSSERDMNETSANDMKAEADRNKSAQPSPISDAIIQVMDIDSEPASATSVKTAELKETNIDSAPTSASSVKTAELNKSTKKRITPIAID